MEIANALDTPPMTFAFSSDTSTIEEKDQAGKSAQKPNVSQKK